MRLSRLLPAGLLLAALPASAITIDGTAEVDYGPAVSIQTTQTQFGDNNDPDVGTTNGSELDAAYGTIQGSSLFLVIAGNLESNFNKLELFIDSAPGGQNKLRGDNPDVDFNGLNRMGDDGSGNGLTFDSGFESDYYVTATGGNIPYQLFASYAETPTGGGGIGRYLGEGGAVTDGTLSGGDNPDGIKVTVNNSNIGGVDGGCDAATGAGVLTGFELEIPLAAIGNPTGCVRVVAMVNGGSHDFLSNQVLGPLPAGTCNLGEPRAVNLELIDGVQSFEVCPGPVSLDPSSWGRLKAGYR